MEKPLIKPQGSRFGTILRNRKLLATVSLLGGLFVLKATGCLESKSVEPVEPEPRKPAVVEQATNINKSQQRAEKAFRVVYNKIVTKESVPEEIHVPDDVGFGGPDPEEKEDRLSDKKSEMANLFLSLPYDDLKVSVQEFGFDQIQEIANFMEAFKDLREAIKSGSKIKIEQSAQAFLKATSLVETLKVKKEYRRILKEYRLRERGMFIDEKSNMQAILSTAVDSAELLTTVE